MTDEILKRIDALAAKLGVAGVELWRILIRQARVEAITDIIWIVGSLLGIYSLFKLGYYCKAKIEDDEVLISLMFASFVGMVVLFITCIVQLIDLPTPLFNPEYRALELLRNAIK